MSNIYITEPPTNGKVLLTTSVGDIDIELWSKETPKACRNFIQLCMEGYYNGTLFHRLVKGFIVQGGDPLGTGEGGDSIYGQPFKDEFHSRLRFTRRGLVAMANAGKNDNGSQFFFTLGAAPELNNKHTIFGKVMGDTLYNMLRLEEMEIGADDNPVSPHKIVKTQILYNPYDDIIPRSLPKIEESGQKDKQKKKSKSKATKNFALLSFGEEAEEDEMEVNIETKKSKGKSKSSHDLLDDRTLSTEPAVEVKNEKKKKKKIYHDDSDSSDSDEEDDLEPSSKSHDPVDISNIRKKLHADKKHKKKHEDERDNDDRPKHELSKLEELKREAKLLRKQLRETQKEAKEQTEENNESAPAKPKPVGDDMISQFKAEGDKYVRRKKNDKSNREAQCLAMLAKFKSKVRAMGDMSEYNNDNDDKEGAVKEENSGSESDEGDGWLGRSLHSHETAKQKVLDANIYDAERYELHDPRNPITKRRLEASKQKMKEAKRRRR